MNVYPISALGGGIVFLAASAIDDSKLLATSAALLQLNFQHPPSTRRYWPHAYCCLNDIHEVELRMKCIWCESPMEPNPSGRKKKYCKRSCRQRAYEARVGRSFSAAGEQPEIVQVWNSLRDQYSDCYLCGLPLDYSDSTSVCFDHMIATVWGGRTDVDNLRPVHVGCNLKKAAKLISPADFGQSPGGDPPNRPTRTSTG